MLFPIFRYMAWAKEHARGARWNLALSGLAEPPLELLELPSGAPPAPLLGGEHVIQAEKHVAERFGVPWDHAMLTLGTSHALYVACGAALTRGARVLVERPAYEALVRVPAFFGAAVHRFERSQEEGWGLPRDLPQRIRDLRPSLLLLTNPHNPSGVLLDLETLEPILRELRACGGTLLADEVYLEFLPDPPPASAIRLGSPVAVASSLTKAYGLGGLRFGWLLGEASLVARARQCNDLVAVLHPAPSAVMGLQALQAHPALAARARDIQRGHLPILWKWVESRGDVEGVLPRGGIIGFLRLCRVADTQTFAARLRQDHDTQVVPGEFFEAPGWVRVGVGAPEEELREGLIRLGRALDSWEEPESVAGGPGGLPRG